MHNVIHYLIETKRFTIFSICVVVQTDCNGTDFTPGKIVKYYNNIIKLAEFYIKHTTKTLNIRSHTEYNSECMFG